MVTRRAECSCGQLAAVCTGEPVRVSICHCLACKRRTGSAFSFNARFPEGSVSIEGRSKEFTRIGDEGGRVTYSFCPECGTTVHYRIDRQPGLVASAVLWVLGFGIFVVRYAPMLARPRLDGRPG